LTSSGVVILDSQDSYKRSIVVSKKREEVLEEVSDLVSSADGEDENADEYY